MTDYLYQLATSVVTNNQFFQGGMVLGILAAVGYQLKPVPEFALRKLRSWVTYSVHFDQSSDFYRVFTAWLNEAHPQKFRNVEVKFNTDKLGEDMKVGTSTDSGKKFQLWKFQYSDSNTIRHKGRWLWITKTRKEMNSPKDIFSMFYNSYTISGIFAKRAIDDLCDEISRRRNLEADARGLRVGFNVYGYFNFRPAHTVKPLDQIFVADKDQLIQDLRRFTEQKEFYREKGINYKRSYLFYGPGGTGKTSLAQAIANFLGYDLYLINLASIEHDQQLQSLGSRITKNSVVLLEDVDCVLADRKVDHEHLNFSTVLNFLDGLYAPSNCVFVLTTNHPEVLDDALVRKGRVDLALHIDFPTVRNVEQFVSDFYNESVVFPGLHGKTNVGMSAVQDICLRHATSAEACPEITSLFDQIAVTTATSRSY